MKKMKQRIVSLILTVIMVCMMMPVTAFASGNVAKIGDVEYATLDEAVEEAPEGSTIELLQDATTNGMNLSKDLTIQAAEGLAQKPTVTFTQYGIALWGKALTFKNCNVVMNGVGSTPYTAEWGWMSICASTNASLTLDNVNMMMDAEGVSNSPHAIYFCNNNVLNLVNGTSLTIKNYPQDALEWDGGNNGYNVNIKDSTFISDNNRSGFTGTFYATIENSDVDVINSRGNGSNGSHFIIENSNVNFSDNGSHGLSAGELSIDSSIVTANNNHGMGIAVDNGFTVKNRSRVTVTGNADNSTYGYAAVRLYNEFDFAVDSTSTLHINDNNNTGLYVRQGSLTVENGADLEITGNKVTHNALGGYGGGIYVGYGDNYDPTVVLPADAEIYNNHAITGGDDIYVSEGVNGPSLTFGETGRGWSLDGGEDCNGEEHLIDGWYDDSEGARWEAHAETEEGNHIVEFTEFDEVTGLATINGLNSFKAAHGKEADKKTSYPGLDKWVEGEEQTSVAAGETIEFELESNVPEDLLNYLEPETVATPSVINYAFENPENGGKYELKFHDVMDEALSLDQDSFAVTVNGETISEDYYEVILNPEDDCTFEVYMDLVQLYKNGIITQEDFGQAKIIVTYTATAKEDIVHGTYYNRAWVEYEKGESEEDTVTVYTYQLEIFKYDQSTNEGLGGAKFQLYQKDENGDIIEGSVRELISGADGYIVVEGLDGGIYYLKETEAPEGYVCSEEELEVDISGKADAEQIVKVKFANSNIPHTGGTGTRMYTIGGAAIIAAAGILLVVSRRKKEDR